MAEPGLKVKHDGFFPGDGEDDGDGGDGGADGADVADGADGEALQWQMCF